jgi:two-component system phosphate regulon sensor histidine kinase PhoR
MREERAALEAILNGTDDAIIVTDPTDRILFFNPAAQHAFLDDERPLAGDSFAQVVRNEALLDLWGEPASREANTAEIPMSDGRTFNASLTVIPGVGRVAVMQNITHLKEMDKVKSEFVSTVSHDLRSPLQVIQTSAELLPRMGELSLEQHKEVDHILAVVRRMADLVQNLLDIGRIEAGIGMEVEPCAIDEIIAAVAGSFRTLAQSRHLDLTIDLPKTLPLVYGNRLRLEQVISNLLQNAIKFTPEGTVSVVAWSEDGQVIIEVNDTGIGIPLEAQDALFQKFYRVNSPLTRGIQGTGLGLAIVKSIVENYRGKIEVESTPRLGSTFRVTFPVYGEEQRLTSEHLPYENNQHQAADRQLHQAG